MYRTTALLGVLIALGCFHVSAHAAEVGWWSTDFPDTFQNGTWLDVFGAAASTSSGTVTEGPDGIVFDGASSLSVDAETNPVAGLEEFSLTSKFKVVQGGSRRDPNNGNQFWANGMLIGRELPGGARGDFGLSVNSENELVSGWGNPDLGIVDDVALNDDEFHAATATFNVNTGTVTLYRDGQLVATQDNPGQIPEAETLNIGVNILDVANDTAYFTGTITTLIVDDTEMSAMAVADLHSRLLIPEPSTGCLVLFGFLAIGRFCRRSS